MDNTIVAAFIGVAGGLLGAWLGGIISRKASLEAAESSNKNAIFIMREQERKATISNLRAAFASHLAYLRGMRSSEGDNGSLESVREYLYAAFIDIHASELEKFRFFIESGSLTAYDKTCEDYEHQLYPGFNVDTKGKTPQEYFIAQIEDLLHFAD